MNTEALPGQEARAPEYWLCLKRIPELFIWAAGERLSRYETGVMIAGAFNRPELRIKTRRQNEVPMDAPRPADVSMDISKALGLGYNPLLLNDELELIAENNYI